MVLVGGGGVWMELVGGGRLEVLMVRRTLLIRFLLYWRLRSAGLKSVYFINRSTAWMMINDAKHWPYFKPTTRESRGGWETAWCIWRETARNVFVRLKRKNKNKGKIKWKILKLFFFTCLSFALIKDQIHTVYYIQWNAKIKYAYTLIPLWYAECL